MSFVLNNLFTIYIPLLIFALILIFFLRKKHIKFNNLSHQKLAVVYNEIKKEKLISQEFNTVNFTIKSLDNNTQSKLLKIKVDVLTIDFAIREIIT